MKVQTYKTKKVNSQDSLVEILASSLPTLNENDVVVITSKIVAITQGRIIKNDGKIDKDAIVNKEADLILPEKHTRYGVRLSVKNNILIASAGVDESNGKGYFILWPDNPGEKAVEIWRHLRDKYRIKNLGVIITDSHLSPMRKGVTGLGLAWAGFVPLRDYIGTPDIFGKNLLVTKTNIVDGLSSAAVVEMGEGNEQTPLAVINEIKNIQFVDRAPTQEEIKEMTIDLDEDVYTGLLKSVEWQKGFDK